MTARTMTTIQGLLWSSAAQDWAELQEPAAAPLWEVMLDAAAVGPGTRLLDAGCGAGGASVVAARRGAHVNGIDAAEALLAIARRRVPDGDFHRGDLEDLPYASGTFDAVIAADVVPYAADPGAALCEVRRACVPGGRVVIAIWDRPEECEQHAIVRALRRLVPLPLGEEPFMLSAPGVLDALVMRSGLRVVGGGVVTCRQDYPDFAMAWQAQVSAGPLQAALRVVGQKPLTEAMHEALAPYTASTGGVRLVNRYRYLTVVPAEDRRASP